MAFHIYIPTKYLANIPALYLAGIASFDIISDVLHHNLILFNLVFNLLLCLPLVLRYHMVYLIYGTLISFVCGLIYIAQFVWFIKYLRGAPCQYPFETFVIGPIFATLTLLAGLSFLYVARRLSYKW